MNRKKVEGLKESTIDEQIYLAVSKRNLDSIRCLLERNPNIYAKALNLACSFGFFKLIEYFLEYGAANNSFVSDKNAILALCSSKSKKEDALLSCLELLIKHGSDVNAWDTNRTCAMSYSVKHNHVKLTMKLIIEGADINSTDSNGWSPIFYAVVNQNMNLVSLLKDYGANIYLLDVWGRSLVDIAEEIENENIIKLLNGNLDLCKWYARLPPKDEKYSSVFEIIQSNLPNRNDRFSGFNQEYYNILKSLDLNHLTGQFCEHNVGFGQFLTIDDRKLKEVGAIYWFERKKLLNAIQKFHEHPWSTSSLNTPSQELDIKITQLMTTIMRQLYIISISTYLWRIHGGIDVRETKLSFSLKNSLRTVKNLRSSINELNFIFGRIDQNQNQMPSDYIKPVPSKFNVTSMLVKLTLCGSFIYLTNLHSRVYNVVINTLRKA